VLRYIDFCLDPRRPFVFNLNGGPGEMRRALREANAGLWAAEERLAYTQDVVDAQRRLVAAVEDLRDLNA
jgi:hypothetical protein